MSDTSVTSPTPHGDLETVLVADVVQAARDFGVQHLPDADRMVAGRVWPVNHGWIAEAGEGNNIRALDDIYESMVDAIKAAATEIRRLRDLAVKGLADGGEQTARLWATRGRWQPLVLTVFADSDQKQPWRLEVPDTDASA